MKKRLLSGSFALFLLALLSPSWSQQQKRSQGAGACCQHHAKARNGKALRVLMNTPMVLLGFFLILMFLSPLSILRMPDAISHSWSWSAPTRSPSQQPGSQASCHEAGRIAERTRGTERDSWWSFHLPQVILWHMYIGPEHHTLSRLAAGLHMKPPASPASRGHGLSRTVLSESRESGCFSG